MRKKFLTIEDLYQFCKSNNFSHFNSMESNGPIILQSFEEIESDGDSNNGLCPVKLKSCHIGLNANKSTISEQSMKAALDSFRGRPILGSIIKLDSGEYDFHSHDMEFVTNEDGETEIEYIEIPVGVTDQVELPTLEYDKNEDKTYVMINGNIFEDYSKAADIMRRRRTAKCSVEIAVEELSYDADQDALSIDKFHFTGVTILGHEPDGTEIQEGMKGSKITIDSFSADNNGMLGINYQDKMIEVLDRLNTTLSKFNIDSEQKGGNVNMENEEIMESVVEEPITETMEEISEESVEETAAEEMEETSVEEVTSEEESPATEEFVENEPEALVCTFRISHDDTRYGLQSLLNAMCDESHFYSVIAVYDKYFYYVNYYDGNAFKQNYKIRKDVVSFVDDPIPVFTEFVTQEERDELEKLRKDYAALKEFKNNYDASVLKAKKTEILDKAEYECLAENAEFAKLRGEMDDYSVEELSTKADLIFAAHMKSTMEFSAKVDETKKPKTIGVNFNKKESKKGPYGTLFDR